MWRAPQPNDPYIRDDDTHFYQGARWIYCFSMRTMQLRRYSLSSDAMDITVARQLPRNQLHLTQIFYNKRRSPRYMNYTPPYRPPGHEGLWQGSPRPRIHRVDVSSLDIDQLNIAYRRLNPTAPTPVMRTWTSVMLRVADMPTERGLVLVDHIPDRASAMTIGDLVHIIHAEEMPAEAVVGSRKSPRHSRDAHIIRMAEHSPKKRGSASARRWDYMRVGMTVGEYIAECESRGFPRTRAALDIQHDVEHGHIELDE